MIMDELRTIVENAQCDPVAFGIIRRHLVGILTHLGVSNEASDKWACKQVQNKKISDLSQWEVELQSELASLGIYSKLDERMKERAREWFNKIEPYLLKANTLDLGGGSGELAQLMQTYGCAVSIADVLDWRKVDLPFLQVKENKIEIPDGSFDQVVLLTVFHHSNDIQALIKEAFRVAKRRVLFIESVTENLVGYQYGAWIDWFYNHVLHYSPESDQKINVPCNFLPATGWEQLVWKLTGFRPTTSVNIGVYQFLNPENHHLFVYDLDKK
jgi:ubiquinone/menaquinone biosynthesis C-methylase UbiE